MGGRLRAFLVLLAVVGGAPALPAATRTWLTRPECSTNAEPRCRWSDASNWGGTAPQPGDDLVFPAYTAPQYTRNDFPSGTLFNSITAGGMSYLFDDPFNPVTTRIGAGGLTVAASSTVEITFSVHLEASQIWTIGSGSQIQFFSWISLDGHALTIDTAGQTTFWSSFDGAGSLAFTGDGTSVLSYPVHLGSAPLSARGGEVLLAAWQSAITGDGGTLWLASGPASPTYYRPFGAVSVSHRGAVTFPGAALNRTEVNGGVVLTPGSRFIPRAFWRMSNTLTGTMTVTGPVVLGASTLELSIQPTSYFVPDRLWTIISNDAADAVVGTFAGLPEGSSFVSNGYTFSITYTGGDGNDVVLRCGGNATTAETRITLIGPESGRYGEPLTFVATVTSPSGGTPSGFVSFSASPTLASIPLVDGRAVWTTSTLPEGPVVVLARYEGDAGNAGSAAAALVTIGAAAIEVPALGLAGLAALVALLGLTATLVLRH